MPPSSDKRLLHEAVRVKDNSAQIAAMEAALPYLYMLRQLRAAYRGAWRRLCGGRRGACPALLRLPATTKPLPGASASAEVSGGTGSGAIGEV